MKTIHELNLTTAIETTIIITITNLCFSLQIEWQLQQYIVIQDTLFKQGNCLIIWFSWDWRQLMNRSVYELASKIGEMKEESIDHEAHYSQWVRSPFMASYYCLPLEVFGLRPCDVVRPKEQIKKSKTKFALTYSCQKVTRTLTFWGHEKFDNSFIPGVVW